MLSPERSGEALQVYIDRWYPECWEIEITERLDAGILGYGISMTGGEVATLFTVYANNHESVTEGIEAIRASEHVYSVSQMASVFRQASIPKPGNATCDLLVVHDGRK